jgi:hypothetical protein
LETRLDTASEAEVPWARAIDETMDDTTKTKMKAARKVVWRGK